MGECNGQSWATAYKELRDALDASPQDDIRVAQGIYAPASPGGSRDETFQLVNGIAIEGGYAGYGAPDPDERDFEVYRTTLSGDLNGNDGPDFANYDENSYHVVTGADCDGTAILDGFTISGGNADLMIYADGRTFPDTQGSGILVARVDLQYAGNPTIRDCIIEKNSGTSCGGMYCIRADPALTRCTFRGNRATGDLCEGGMEYACGNCGALGISVGCDVELRDCVFEANTARRKAGALGVWSNQENEVTTVTLVNCLFTGNSSTGDPDRADGGAIHCEDHVDVTLSGCTLADNSAQDEGGAIYATLESGRTLTASNCIIWGNTAVEGAQIYETGAGTVSVYFSDVQGGWTGLGSDNINGDPLFEGAGSYRLSSALSPCVELGSKNLVPPGVTTDLDGSWRIVDGDSDDVPTVDMGSYEYHVCSQDSGCDDSNDCTDNLCDTGVCQYPNLGAGIFCGGDPSGDCDAQNTCDGAGTCQENYQPSSQVCRADAGDCDVPEYCPGDSAQCPVNSYEPEGTGCGDFSDTDCTDPDTCDGAGLCQDNHAASNTPCDDELFCNGADTCLDGDCSEHSGNPCEPPLETCDEDGDTCVPLVLLVDYDAPCPSGCDGKTWDSAYQDLQDALNAAETTYPYVTEIWVKGNTSAPYIPSAPGGVSSTFTVRQGLALYGGFAGDETERDQRNPAANETILSGDRDNDDPGDLTDNVYHVVTGATGCDSTAILDGFTPTAGYARGVGTNLGAGMYNNGASPTVANCIFRGNTATGGGGGMWNGNSSDPEVRSCIFEDNGAGSAGSVRADEPGGGMANDNSSPDVTNCLFFDNRAFRGGAMSNQNGSAPVITNCTFAENETAGDFGKGGGLYNEGTGTSISIANSIFWDNTDGGGSDESAQIHIEGEDATLTIDYSCVDGWTGGLGGTGNIDDDPQFNDAVGGDYRLCDDTASPCVEAGDNAGVPVGVEADLDGAPRIVDGDGDDTATVDMGAYEYADCNGNDEPDASECPAAPEFGPLTSPERGIVDARKPHPPGATTPCYGFGMPDDLGTGVDESTLYPIIIDLGVTGVDAGCWTLCETEALGGNDCGSNSIQSVTDNGDGTYTINLHHGIEGGTVTTIQYLGGYRYIEYVHHPADVDGTGTANANDIVEVVDCLNSQGSCENYEADIDASNAQTANDIIEEIDLLNGAGAYSSWYGTTVPENNGECPACPVTGSRGGDGLGGGGGGSLGPDQGGDDVAFGSWFAQYLMEITLPDWQAMGEFLITAEGLTGWCVDHLTAAEKEELIAVLSGPETEFASPFVEALVPRIVEVLQQ